MPTTYLSPGVYVEEVDSGPQPIQGVSTSVTGAVGVTVQGPTSGKPVLVTSFADFQNTFGGVLPPPDPGVQNQWALNQSEGGQWWQFPLSVKGFFDNGGQQLYVKRVYAQGGGVPGKGATAASASFYQGLVAEVAQDTTPATTAVKLAHLIDVKNGTNLNFYANGQLVAGSPFTVVSYSPTNNTVTLNNPIGFGLKAGRDLAVIDPLSAAAAANQALSFQAKALGDWGNNISVRVAPMVGGVFTLLPDPVGGGTAFTTQLKLAANAGDSALTVVDGSGFKAAGGDHVRIAGQEYTLAAATATTVDISPAKLPTALPSGTSVTRMRLAAAAGATSVHVSGASAIYDNAILQFDNGAHKDTVIVPTNGVNGEVVTTTALVWNYYEGHKVRIIEAEVDTQNTVNGVVQASETIQNLRMFDDQTTSFIVTGVNLRSALVNVSTGAGYSATLLSQFPAAVPAAAGNPVIEWVPLVNGDDHLEQLTVEDFIGVDLGSEKRTGIQALEDITDISICVVPGMWAESIQSALINHCETLRYRFAILDPPDKLTIDQIITFREPLDTKFAALYYPWIQVLDPSTVVNVDLAPSGHMAGLYAQTDNDRGVFKAPANIEISQITKIAQDVNKREQDLLNPIGINALRFFPLRGNRVWGARTLSSESAWKYINVKRLFIYVEASIDYGTQWVVFEPNDATLWARIRQTIGDFLDTTWRSGALQGTTAAQAYFVKCDMTTMTQDDIDNGRLICVIGIAPVKPAEFVIFRIQQFTQPTTAS